MGDVARALHRLVPGWLRVTWVTALSFLVARWSSQIGLGATALAVLFGVLVGNVWGVEASLRPGVRFTARHVLAVAVVLLGLQVDLAALSALGAPVILLVVGVVAGALALALAFSAWLGVDPRLGALLGVGTGICGASAIAAVRPAIGASEEEVTYAVAAVTLLGSVGLLAYPVLQWLFHPLAGPAFGVWSGSTLHSVPQAVGAGFAVSGEAGMAATVVKLGRVAMLAPVAVVLGVAFRAPSAADDEAPGRWAPLRRLPFEVWGFLALVLVATADVVPAALAAKVVALDRVLLVAALAALGLQTRFLELRRTGAAPMGVAVLTWGFILLAGLTALRLTT